MKKLSLIILLLGIVSCSDYSTHGKFVTEHHDAWIDGFVPGGKPAYSEIDREEDGDIGLVFCKANVDKETGKASPVCYKPTIAKK